jgi:S-adenosylmethionine:tRNA ribosyltransferase-isomerase
LRWRPFVNVKTADFDYDLPPDRIAQHPPPERDAARMLVLDPRADRVADATVRELPRFLDPGDLLVLNDSRVLPARLLGRRDDGGAVEVLLLRPLGENDRWEALTRPRRRLPVGSRVRFEGSALRVAIEEQREGTAIVHLAGPEDPLAEVRRIGEMPTPPYIKAHLDDPERYQTVFSREEGSAAAPTAGLHFTPGLLDAVRERGVEIAFVTLHVGLDTFRPVRVGDPAQHAMHREWFRIDAGTADAVARTRERDGRVVAVGTTCVRVLESAAEGNGVRVGSAWTSLLILPGHRFRVVDAMLTNFHLPKSTLLMLVSAFAGRERILRAYRHAIDSGYRFYSFGDCMLIATPSATLPARARELSEPILPRRGRG